MTRTLKRILLSVSTLILSCCLALGFVACKKSAMLKEEYYAYYGERFILPQVESGQFTVTDGDGTKVEIVMGGFSVDSKSDYTLTVKHSGGTDSAKIKVLERGKVTIGTPSDYVFASLNEEKQLPAFTAANDDGTKAELTTKLVSPSGVEVGENLTSFTPTETGNYLLTATATSGESSKVEIEVGETNYHDDLLARMGRAESKYMVVNTYGVKASVNTEDKQYIYGSESGSLKLQSRGDAVTGGNFQLTNFSEPDISDYNGFYFFIYNDATIDIRIIVNQIWSGQFMVTLRSKEWTPVMITNYMEQCAAASNPIVSGYMSKGHLNGLHFYYDAKGSGLPEFDFYISDIYRMPEVTVAEMNRQFNALPSAANVQLEDKAKLTDTINRIELLYHTLPEGEKKQVNYSKAAQIKQQFVWLEHPEEAANKEDDVVVYFNSEVGLSQTSILVEPQGEIEKEITAERAYGNEGKSLHLYLPEATETESRYSFDIHVNVPMITDFSGENDYCYAWIYNASDSDFLYYGWLDNSVGWNQPIEKGKWNLIYMTNPNNLRSDGNKATANNVTGFKLTFMAAYSKTSPDKKSSNANAEADLYISNIRAMNESTLRSRLALTADNSASYLNDTLTYYRLTDSETKDAFAEYSMLLMQKYNSVIDQTETVVSKATTVEKLDEVNAEIATLEYVYKLAPNLVKTATINNLDALRAAYVNKFASLTKDTADFATVERQLKDCLYRYMQIKTAQSISADFTSEYADWLTKYGVTDNGNAEIVRFGSAENAYKQMRVQFSYSSGIRDEDGNSINAFDDLSDLQVGYTTEMKYGSESGSTKLAVPVRSKYGSLTFSITMPTITDVSSYDYISFYVYHDSAEPYTIGFNGFKESERVLLKQNEWTEIRIPVSKLVSAGARTTTDLRGIVFTLRDNDWKVDAPANLYFSSIKAGMN